MHRLGRRRGGHQALGPITYQTSLVSHLNKSLDFICYAQLVHIYYLDQSLLLLLLRAVIHLNYLTPKMFPVSASLKPGPMCSMIIGSNFCCLFWQLMSPTPTGTDVSRGYVHGKATTEFVGDKNAYFSLSIIFSNLLLLFLQYLMICLRSSTEASSPQGNVAPPQFLPSLSRRQRPFAPPGSESGFCAFPPSTTAATSSCQGDNILGGDIIVAQINLSRPFITHTPFDMA